MKKAEPWFEGQASLCCSRCDNRLVVLVCDIPFSELDLAVADAARAEGWLEVDVCDVCRPKVEAERREEWYL